ncbi:MAG: hypothetical protein L0241_28285 [Planctomycetia bacterium]|nr:hypothetical protein [Planctomycetia bacterium]
MRRENISIVARSLALGIPLLAVGALGLGCSNADSKTVAVTTLPPEVRNALERAGEVYPEPLKGAKWSEASVLTDSEHAIYQVRGTNARGHKIEAEVTRAGRIIEVEERGIPLEEVPLVVRDTLNSRLPQFTLKQVEAIYQAGNAKPVCYGFEGTDATGKEVELYISADGKTLLN